MKNILDNTLDDFKEFFADLGEKTFRAQQVFDWIYKKHVFKPSLMKNMPKDLQDILEVSFEPFPLTTVEKQVSKDLSRKSLYECLDGARIEAVSMNPDNKRMTFCISTQAGCPIKCEFCETGQHGFLRNLNAGEIIAQVLMLEMDSSRPSNIVLMGMGESLLNFDAVDKFVRIISFPNGYGFSERRITLSTAGIMSELERFHKIHPLVELAISLNASNDETRKKLMPNKKLASYSNIIKAIPNFDKGITLEYVLLSGVNDTKKDAETLASSIRHFKNVKVNLIRYNKTSCGFKPSTIERVHQFQEILVNAGIKCFIRRSLGSDIKAACGQMYGKKKIQESKKDE